MKHYAVKEKKEKKKREREQTRLSFFREKYLAYIFSSFSRTIFSFFSNYRFFKKKKEKRNIMILLNEIFIIFYYEIIEKIIVGSSVRFI